MSTSPIYYAFAHNRKSSQRGYKVQKIRDSEVPSIPGEVEQWMFRDPPTKGKSRTTHTALARAHHRQQSVSLPSYKQPPLEKKSVTSTFQLAPIPGPTSQLPNGCPWPTCPDDRKSDLGKADARLPSTSPHYTDHHCDADLSQIDAHVTDLDCILCMTHRRYHNISLMHSARYTPRRVHLKAIMDTKAVPYYKTQ